MTMGGQVMAMLGTEVDGDTRTGSWWDAGRPPFEGGPEMPE